jgi:hypothetical protein
MPRDHLPLACLPSCLQFDCGCALLAPHSMWGVHNYNYKVDV